ncbi:MAG: thioredoxin domain-containing protein [Polyangiaceae bacterium]|jgi:uncharacterized protein YyaL (SSP411 family)
MPNRLVREVSPYLRQHGDNPVDWFPWGPEALDRAAAEDKPILLSIGYSACHWCHVMAAESFENKAIAQLMNEWFINIKVDREERPDLDQIYQSVVQLTGRSGGWPLTVFLTPNQRPFFGGTYFPPVDRYGMSGFPKVLQAVWEAYRTRREQVDAQADEIALAIAEASAPGPCDSVGLSPALIDRAMQKVIARFDDAHGGFGHRPKFPNATCLDLLLRAGARERLAQALYAMRLGGIWDHLGGGFHRYSTDERWRVPHFEKMLYDNAQLLRLYADAWRAVGDPLYERTAREIAAYVAREMTAPDGGFYTSQDADSEGQEGRFFVWSPREIDIACDADVDAARVARLAFGVTEQGNFENTGSTVLSRTEPLDRVAQTLGLGLREAEDALDRARSAMLSARERRVRPLRDDKILASWNGLMAGALAIAGAALDDRTMVAAAARALSFIEGSLVVAESETRTRVLRHSKDGVVRGPGFLDDHAFVGDAALDLYEATARPEWVRLARSIAESILAHFHDASNDTFFFTPDDGEAILVRPRDVFDHAVPSGAAIACRLLLRLGGLAHAPYGEVAARAIERLAPAAANSPLGMSVTVALADRLVRGCVDVVIVGPTESSETRAMARVVQRTYVPDRLLAWADPTNPRAYEACVRAVEGKPAESGTTAYVCRDRSCSLPLRDPSELRRALVSG